MSDFILTIESDDELKPSTSHTQSKKESKTRRNKREASEEVEESTAIINPGFFFDAIAPAIDDPIDRFRKKNAPPRVSIDDIIARHKQNNKLSTKPETELEDWDEDSLKDEDTSSLATSDQSSQSGQDTENEDTSDADTSDEDDELKDSGLDEDDELEKGEDLQENTQDLPEEKPETLTVDKYFDQTNMPFEAATKEELAADSLGSASLSRPILLGLASMSITSPTPIQRQTIPLALLGKDLVCSSVTGSGKTLGYMIPILERLMWRDKKGGGRSRVMVLAPTRELAVQVFQVGKMLARYTDITFSLCVGGMNLRTQEAELRERPEIIIGTPGRVIDHVRNTQGFSLDTLEILVIDEADRILEEGFHDELEEIISHCPRSRQTMLFSATVSESVADLARLSLDKPIRVKIDPPKSTAVGLTQEFLKVRDDPGRRKSSTGPDLMRQAILISLCKTSSFGKGRTIIFFRSKAGAHRMKIIFSLFSLKSEELHGDLTQEQRLSSLQKFKDGKISYLLATDLASRGLDIKGVERVINYEPPRQYDVYLHRIGRTARAGKKGSALTLVGESDRKLIKEARKNCLNEQGAIKQRKIDSNVVLAIKKELEALSSTIAEILQEEREEKELKKTEMELKKGQNLIEYDEEIKSRPARTWFQSEADKKKSKNIGTAVHTAAFSAPVAPETKKGPKRDRFDGMSRKQKRRKMALEEDMKEKNRASMDSSIRAAKKAQRPIKINANPEDYDSTSKSTKRKKNNKKDKKSKSSFSSDMTAKKTILGRSDKNKSTQKSSVPQQQRSKNKKTVVRKK